MLDLRLKLPVCIKKQCAPLLTKGGGLIRNRGRIGTITLTAKTVILTINITTSGILLIDLELERKGETE
jgi:hypothetical protein